MKIINYRNEQSWRSTDALKKMSKCFMHIIAQFPELQKYSYDGLYICQDYNLKHTEYKKDKYKKEKYVENFKIHEF